MAVGVLMPKGLLPVPELLQAQVLPPLEPELPLLWMRFPL